MSASKEYVPTPLADQRVTNLDWSTEPFVNFDIKQVHIIRDGSCLFHAIANGINKSYKLGIKDGRPLDRSSYIRDFRNDLSIKLGSHVDITDPESPIWYDTISRGNLREFTQPIDGEELHPSAARYTLEQMQKELASSNPVDFIYNELISELLDIDIYILDNETNDVYIVGDDLSLYYKNRNSIVLLYVPGHYDLVGIKTNNGISTLFTHNHPFIEAIRDRLVEKIRLGAPDS